MKKTIISALLLAFCFTSKAQSTVTWSPDPAYDGTGSITVHYNPYASGGDHADTIFQTYSGPLYAYAYLTDSVPGTGGIIGTYNNGSWLGVDIPVDSLQKVSSTDYVWVIPNVRSFFGVPDGVYVQGVNIIFHTASGDTQSANAYVPVAYSALAPYRGESVTYTPSPVVDSSEAVVVHYHPYNDTSDGAYTPSELAHDTSMYVYTWAITATGSYQYATWGGVPDSAALHLTEVDSNDFTFTIPNLRYFYENGNQPLPVDSAITQFAVIFRNAAGDTQTANFYINVSAPTPTVTATTPPFGPIITWTPGSVADSSESLVVTYHPQYDSLGPSSGGSLGDSIFKSYGAPIYVYVYANTAGGTTYQLTPWSSVGSTPGDELTEVDDNDYVFTLPDFRAAFVAAGVPVDTGITGINLIFRTQLGDTQTNGYYIPVTAPSVPLTFGPVITWTPDPLTDSFVNLTVTFHPQYDSVGPSSGGSLGDSIFKHYSGPIYVYAYINTLGGTTYQLTPWGSVGSTPSDSLSETDINDYVWTLNDFREAFIAAGAPSSAVVTGLNVIFRTQLGDTQTNGYYIPVTAFSPEPSGPIITWAPDPLIDSSESLSVTFHPQNDSLGLSTGGSLGDSIFKYYAGTLYTYAYVNTPSGTTYQLTPWSSVGSTPGDSLVKTDANDYVFTVPDFRAAFLAAGVPIDTSITGLNLIFRNQAGDTQTNGYYIPVSAPSPAAATGPVLTYAPDPLVDSTESVIVHYHPRYDTLLYTGGSDGDVIFKHFSGTLYVYSYVYGSDGVTYQLTPWSSVGTTPTDSLTMIDSNDYVWNISNLRADFIAAGMPSTTLIDSLALIFRTASGDTQTVNFYIPTAEPATAVPFGPIITWTPDPLIDTNVTLAVTYHPLFDSLTGLGDSAFKHSDEPIYVYAYASTAGGTTYQLTPWSSVGSTHSDSLVRVDSNHYVWTLTDFRDSFVTAGVPADTAITGVNLIFRNQAGDTQTVSFYIPVSAPPPPALTGDILTYTPDPVIDSEETVTIHYHPQYDSLLYSPASHDGDQIFKTYTGTIYVYSYVYASDGSTYQLTPWGSVGSTPTDSTTRIDSNDYVWTLTNLRSSFIAAGMPSSVDIDSLAVIFRTESGDTQTVNFYIPVTEPTVPTPVDTVSGTITFGGAAYSGDVTVRLITYNSGALRAVDSLTEPVTGTGVYYQFTGVYTDTFLVQASVSSVSSFATNGYAPSYLPATLHWNDAVAISHTSGTNSTGENITMLYGTSTAGTGSVSGMIDKWTSGGAPIADAGVLVFAIDQTSGALMEQTYTDAGGNYRFTTLPAGTYEIWPEVLNYATTTYAVSVGTEAVNFDFFQDTIALTITPYTVGVPKVNAVTNKIAVYPNPAHDELTISSTAAISNVTIEDVASHTVYAHDYNTPVVQISVADLATGVYMIRINNTEVRKFVKE